MLSDAARPGRRPHPRTSRSWSKDLGAFEHLLHVRDAEVSHAPMSSLKDDALREPCCNYVPPLMFSLKDAQNNSDMSVTPQSPTSRCGRTSPRRPSASAATLRLLLMLLSVGHDVARRRGRRATGDASAAADVDLVKRCR